MKRIPYVAPLKLQNVDGEPLEDQQTGLQVVSQLQFFRGRISDPAFLEGKESGDGHILQWETRERLSAQQGRAAVLQYWEFEDEQAKQLKIATDKGVAYNKTLSFNLAPFILAVRKMETPKENAAEIPQQEQAS